MVRSSASGALPMDLMGDFRTPNPSILLAPEIIPGYATD